MDPDRGIFHSISIKHPISVCCNIYLIFQYKSSYKSNHGLHLTGTVWPNNYVNFDYICSKGCYTKFARIRCNNAMYIHTLNEHREFLERMTANWILKNYNAWFVFEVDLKKKKDSRISKIFINAFRESTEALNINLQYHNHIPNSIFSSTFRAHKWRHWIIKTTWSEWQGYIGIGEKNIFQSVKMDFKLSNYWILFVSRYTDVVRP